MGELKKTLQMISNLFMNSPFSVTLHTEYRKAHWLHNLQAQPKNPQNKYQNQFWNIRNEINIFVYKTIESLLHKDTKCFIMYLIFYISISSFQLYINVPLLQWT